MRFVVIAHSFPRWPGDIAGSFLSRLTDAFVQRGHTVSVVAPADRGQAGRLTIGVTDVLQVRYASARQETLAYTGDMARSARSPAGALAFLSLVRALRRGAREEARRINAQVVHAFWWVPGGWSATGTGLPTVVSLMGTDVAMMRSFPGRFLGRRVIGRTTRVTALSTFLADEARRLLDRPSLRIDRIPVPVDTSRFQHPAGGTGDGIVYLGRLSAQKRVHLLLEALHARGIRAPVSIIGDGPARGDLERQAGALGLSNVRFLGLLPDGDVPGVLRSAGVAAFLAQREGLGLAAAEAMMLGTPVVATTDGGGVLDLLRDGEGACVVPPTAEAVGAALERCLKDPAMRGRAVTAGERLRHELSPAGVAEQFEKVYAEMT